MIKRHKKTGGQPVWQVYVRAPTCDGPCSHKECKGHRTRKIYVGTFDTWREASEASDRHARESKALRGARDVLNKRMRGVAAERDQLRAVIIEFEDLAVSCDDAIEALQQAVEALSRHA